MTKPSLLLLACSMLALFGRANAQALNVGSDGSDGAFVFVQDTGPGAQPNFMTIDLALAASGLDGQGQPLTWQAPSPVAGRGVYDPFVWAVVFKYSELTVPVGKGIRFKNHPSGAPVVWLSQTNVDIGGYVFLDGEFGVDGVTWLTPGPGGFRGACASRIVTQATSDVAGFGPGGGRGRSVGGILESGNSAGPNTDGLGPAYGAPSAFPLIGGSGAVVQDVLGRRGGAGGGAILIAANQRVDIRSTGSVRAIGGYGPSGQGSTFGSGGTIRIVANAYRNEAASQGLLAPPHGFSTQGVGRLRLEANTFENVISGNPTPTWGLPGQLLPDATTAMVRVVSVTRGGDTLAVPDDPRAAFSPPNADVVLASAGSTVIQLEARNVTPGRTAVVRITNVYGLAYSHTSTPFVGTASLSTASVTVTLQSTIYAVQARVVL